MIRRLYVDNFRSLVDFTWEPGAETLVLGYNGSGKTSALEVVQILQAVCTGERLVDMSVQRGDRTSWRDAPTIRFGLRAEVDGTVYDYLLEIGFGPDQTGVRIVEESLRLDGELLFERVGHRVRLVDPAKGEGAFPINALQSVVAVVGEDLGGERIVPFRDFLARLLYLKPSPFFLYAHKPGKTDRPEESLSDLVPWYLHLATEPSFVEAFTDDLREVWPDLISVKTPEFSPDVFDFVLRVRRGAIESDVPIRSLSDGERLLIGLYVVAAYQKTHPPTTIIVDEPDNFVSLREIQPWLLKMLDSCPDRGQLILISHNEEIIQTFGRENVAYFSRKDHLSPTTVRSIAAEETEVAPMRDLLRRGWLDE